MSLENYKNYVAATDDAERERQLDRHVASVKAHIDEFAAAGYLEVVDNALDLLVMFIPVEYSYFLALQRDPQLNEYAARRGVVLATASNLFAIVSSVQHFWTRQKQLKQINKIIEIGQNLYARINAYAEEMSKVGDALDKSKRQYEESRKKIFGNQGLLTSAKQLEALGVKKGTQNAINALDALEFDE